MTQIETIRRHPDGSIDFDFYRTSATALRRQATRDRWKLRTTAAGALALLCVIAAIASASRHAVGDNVTATLSAPSHTR